MKKLILTLIVLGSQQLFAQTPVYHGRVSGGGALVCQYLVESSRRVSEVTLRFGLNVWGQPADGSISIVRSDGSATLIPIPRSDINSLMIDTQSIPGALIANVHVRSYNIDLLMNYVDPHIRQLSGNVRWNGEVVKFASTELQCQLLPF